MTYTSTVTSKGTVTIPASIRKSLNLKPGSKVSFYQDEHSNSVKIQPTTTWEDLQDKNQAILKRRGHWPSKPYKSGDGFKWYVEQKYGKTRNT